MGMEMADTERMFAFEDLIGWIEEKTLSQLKSAGEEIAKMLNSLIKSLKSD